MTQLLTYQHQIGQTAVTRLNAISNALFSDIEYATNYYAIYSEQVGVQMNVIAYSVSVIVIVVLLGYPIWISVSSYVSVNFQILLDFYLMLLL